MRVLIATHGFPPFQNTGAERAAERIATWLAEHGHHVEVFTTHKLAAYGVRLDSSPQNGMVIHRLSYNLKTGPEPFRNMYDHPAVGAALRGVLANGNFDLVHLVSGYLFAGQVIPTAHEYGLPVALTLTEYFFMCTRLNLMHADSQLCSGPDSDQKCARCLLEEKRRYRYASQLAPKLTDAYWAVSNRVAFNQAQIALVATRREELRAALASTELVICPSRFIIQKFAEYGYDTGRFVFIQHGLNMPDHTHSNQDAREPGGLRIGYMGQIKAHKGLDLLMQATTSLIDEGLPASLQIWGNPEDDPRYSANLAQRSKDYPAIQWNGSFKGERVWEVLGGMDVLVIPSRWYENCPTVILEAYKMGVPVVATHIGGMAELVHHEQSGLLFNLNDAEDLRKQLQRLVCEPGLLETLRAGIPAVKTASQEVEEIFSHYQKLLSNTGQTPTGQ